MPGESEIISRIRQRARATRQVLIGIGDDAAVLSHEAATDLIACCDLMAEGVHFRRDWATPRLIGRKALAVTLSDVAAMGGIARFAMISIALPHALSSDFIEELLEGILELADSSGVSIIGGDTSSSIDSLFIDTSVIGECAAGRAVTRRSAKIGDAIYVTGALGASALGLLLLERGFRLEDLTESDARRDALIKHLAPVPRLKAGQAIGERELATAMIDISDGLSTDLWHVLDESDCGAIIKAGAIPIAGCVQRLAMEDSGIEPLQLALHSGEEYELLFTSPPEDRNKIADMSEEFALPITPIGRVVADKGLQLERDGSFEAILPSGYEHRI
ncbi:MAG: thiamine-phosphate kinase [Blastocatellia bacterium]